jgi:PAS domain S-box-containing protein
MWLQEKTGSTNGPESPLWVRLLLSGTVTLASILLITVLWRRLEVIADPGLILLLTVAVATYFAGGMAGMLSAAIVLFSSFLIFSHPLYPFRYSDLDWRQMMVIAVTCPIIALMVGSLKEQVDRLKVVTREGDEMREEIRRLGRIREARELSDQRYALLADSLPGHAACTLDPRGRVTSWNRGAERLLGYAEPEIRGQSYSRFFTREELLANAPQRLLEQARLSGQAEDDGWHASRAGGRFRSTLLLRALHGHEQGRPEGYLMLLRDLREISQLRNDLEQAVKELSTVKGRNSAP